MRKGQLKVQHINGQKQCSKCKLFVDYQYFWKSKNTRDGFYSSCIDCTRASREPRKETNRQLIKAWHAKNKEYMLEYQRNYDKTRRANDLVYKLRRNVKTAIVASIRSYGDYTSYKKERITKAIFDHLAYTADDLKNHIESLWEPWMNWSNYGKYDATKKTWQIDHIVPQSSLPFTDFNDDNFKKLWELSNLRPLETIENIKKGNRKAY